MTLARTASAWRRLKTAWRDYRLAKMRSKAFARFMHHRTERMENAAWESHWYQEWERLS